MFIVLLSFQANLITTRRIYRERRARTGVTGTCPKEKKTRLDVCNVYSCVCVRMCVFVLAYREYEH